MEPNPYFIDPCPPSRPECGPVSQAGTGHFEFEFEFPAAISSSGAAAVSNDIVFCGKVITTRETENPFLAKSSGNVKPNGFTAWLRSPSARETRWRSSGSSRRHYNYNGLFGTVKFPLQMELSDIKMRQQRMEAPPKLTAEDDGGESCWELVRPLRRRGPLMSALAKATFGCIPLV